MALLPAPALPPPDLPVTTVTVYSDRARVTRSGPVALSGRARVDLPLLPERADPATIRLDAAGAEVQQVDIRRVDDAPLPAAEARALLLELEALDDDIARRRGGRAVLADGVATLRRLQPTLPDSDAQRPFPRLSAGGWEGVLSFLRTSTEKLQRRVRELDGQLEELGRRRAALAERARLVGAGPRRRGYQVTALLSGDGKAKVSLVYMISGARWLPTYDIQLRPAEGRVELGFAGLVSQESGEDWDGAQLVLSTAVPASTMELPRLVTWKLGERERFLPTSRAVQPPVIVAAPPPPPPKPPTKRLQLEDEELRGDLRRRAEQQNKEVADKRPGPARPEAPAAAPAPDRDGDGVKDQVDRLEPAEVEKSVGRELQSEVLTSTAVRGRTYESVVAMAPGVAEGAAGPSLDLASAFRRARKPELTQTMGLMPPPGYAPPALSAELPASQAGGYDLSYPAPAKETVRSGKGQRRVMLFQTAWPVTVHHKLFPALGEETYLVAEIKNPQRTPLPGGRAQLAVGGDAAGTATVKLVAPGEVFTLPLGIDRDVKPLRTVRMTTAERGIISKDEITEYTVTTEIVNPHKRPLYTRIVDQIPITQNREIEIRFVRADPPATPDPLKGSLEWRVAVQPGQKARVQFVYTLRRPQGARLTQ